jgi:putative transposase
VLAVLIDEHQLPVQRACRIVRLSRTAYYRPPPPQMRTDAPVIAALMAVVAAHGRWGFWKCFDRLRLDRHPWNHKRVHRVYCALRLNLPRRMKRRVPTRLRQPLLAPPLLNQTWALDYMTDALYGGQRFRALTILDEGNREGLAIEVASSIPSPRVVRVLEDLVSLHGRPRALRTDNGPEFIAQPLVDWCEVHGVALHYIQPVSLIRMRISNGSIAAIAPKSSMPMPLNRSPRSAISPTPGSRATTLSGPTTASAGCRH